MRVEPEHGVTTAVLDVDEALNPDVVARLGAESVELVRVHEPPVGHWATLRAAGFAIGPSWINWGTELLDDDAFLARLPPRERRYVRAARRDAQRSGVRTTAHDPLDVKSLDRFLALYREQIATMPRGVPFASDGRDGLVETREHFYAVLAVDDAGTLVGGALCLVQEDVSVSRLAFSAVRPSARDSLLVRAVYDAAFAHARERGLRWMSLGTDPCLYGQLTRPGLFRFKARQGFVPIPLQSLDADDGSDEATRVLGIRDLNDPSLLVHYDGYVDARAGGVRWDRPTPLALDVLTTAAETDLGPFRAPFLRTVERRTLPRLCARPEVLPT